MQFYLRTLSRARLCDKYFAQHSLPYATSPLSSPQKVIALKTKVRYRTRTVRARAHECLCGSSLFEISSQTTARRVQGNRRAIYINVARQTTKASREIQPRARFLRTRSSPVTGERRTSTRSGTYAAAWFSLIASRAENAYTRTLQAMRERAGSSFV